MRYAQHRLKRSLSRSPAEPASPFLPRLEDVAGKPVLVVTRFDRANGRRTPFLSAMSMLGAKDNETRSYLEFVDALRRHGAEDDTTASLALAFEVAGYFEIADRRAREIAAEVAAAVSTWRTEAARQGIARQEIDRMASAFEHADLEMARSR